MLLLVVVADNWKLAPVNPPVKVVSVFPLVVVRPYICTLAVDPLCATNTFNISLIVVPCKVDVTVYSAELYVLAKKLSTTVGVLAVDTVTLATLLTSAPLAFQLVVIAVLLEPV